MPAQFTYPGVYVTEQPSGAQAVPAAATSIALFIGMADQGPFATPTRVQGLPDYVRTFGATSVGEMADQVSQFFMNGGGDAYIMRIANGAQASAVDVENEAGAAVLTLTARDKGASGDLIRVEVDYATSSPERTFNLTVYRSIQNADGSFGQQQPPETWSNLTLNPGDPRFVETIVNASSKLIRATSKGVAPAAAGGTSIGGILYRATAANAQADLLAALTAAGVGNSFRISIHGRPAVTAIINKTGLTAANATGRIQDAILTAYQQQLVNLAGTITVGLNAVAPAALGRVLEIQSNEGPVVVTPAATNDLAVALMLGVGAGGIEIDQYSPLRPAPSGVFSSLGAPGGAPSAGWLGKLLELANQDRQDVANFRIDDPGLTAPITGPVAITGTANEAIATGAVASPNTAIGTLLILRNALDQVQASINAKTGTRWMVQRQGFRLILRSALALGSPVGIGVGVTTAKSDLSGPPPGDGFDVGAAGKYWDRAKSENIADYMLGTAPGGGLQSGNVGGLDGTQPLLGDYEAAFATVDSSVEIFNLLVLPRALDQTDDDRKKIWGAASNFAADRRAILFVDPDSSWTDIASAASGADTIKTGVDTRNSVIYWPQVLVPTATGGTKTVDPSGSMAGLYARTDTRFGTWRAPAGIDATLTSVLGVSTPMSDDENGQINPKALNAIRLFPSGITAWGARTMVGADDTGNVDDKYVNVRRMMLLIENSLYRGLRFATFRNNAEPLWASIRLAAGSFMNSLMVQGAFASKTKSEAYYVLCDSTTTTADDVNLGVVNVLVGFAPNKPAEFVHLTVTQIAGQIAA